ncbi:SMI1/KNR4 family protein [Jatrophihabitans sp. YIM 134969]
MPLIRANLLLRSYGTRAGVAPHDLAEVENTLGVKLSQSVRELYEFSDGLYDSLGYPWIWPVADLVAEDRRLRDTTPFDRSFVGIGGDGAGAVFCVRSAPSSPVHCWYPIEMETRQLADDLNAFLLGWADGAITT